MAARAIARFLGVETSSRENPVTATVATTATRVFQNNPNRLLWLAINLSANDGFVAWSSSVSSTRGIRVGANGGFAESWYQEDGELVFQEVWALNNTASGTWFFVEVEARPGSGGP